MRPITVGELKKRLRDIPDGFSIAVEDADGRYSIRTEVVLAGTHDGQLLLFRRAPSPGSTTKEP